MVVVDHHVFAVFAKGCETNTEVNKWSERIQKKLMPAFHPF